MEDSVPLGLRLGERRPETHFRKPPEYTQHMRPELADLILSLLPQQAARPELGEYYAMLRDYPQRGGKGMRSELLLASAQAFGVGPESSRWASALWLAAAVELFQNWVLIHDDIEDDSEERRGRPALHRLHGVPLAINAGDGLHVYMWEAVLRATLPEAMPEVLAMVHHTAEGQHLDLTWVERGEWNLTEQDYLEMVQLKTAYYTVIYPLRLGALVAGQTPPAEFTAAGLALGAAFQIRDDVLNLVGERDHYGKEIAGDLLEGKRTLITLHWLQSASPERRQLFLEQMALPRPQKDPQAISQIHGWLLESGSTDYAQDFAAARAEEGLGLLARALAQAEGVQQAAATRLLASLEGLATRHK